MRQVFYALLLFACALSLALVVLEGLDEDIYRAHPPARFDPNAMPGKQWLPHTSQPFWRWPAETSVMRKRPTLAPGERTAGGERSL